ncbi:MAG: hypothetical protein DRO36_06555, partial [Candidatus Hecatellales archaeon]
KYERFRCPVRNLLLKISKRLGLREDRPINKVDVAFARPVRRDIYTLEIIGGIKLRRKGSHRVGSRVKKAGATTGVTEGEIVDDHFSGWVEGRRGRAWYEDVVLVRGFSKGGDSGSPVYDDEGSFYGLLFAGSETHFIYSKVENIERLGGVEVCF